MALAHNVWITFLDNPCSTVSVLKFPFSKRVRPPAGPDPHVTICIFDDWSNAVVRQSLVFSETCKLSVVTADEPVRSADPEPALLVFVQKTNVVTFEGRRVFFVEDGEVQSIETCDTLLRSDPKIAIARLDD